MATQRMTQTQLVRALAEHGELLRLDEEHVLHVRVDDSAWMQQFVHMRSALANDLGRIAAGGRTPV